MNRPIPILAAKLVLIAVFFAFIFLPPVKTMVSPDTVWSSVEKRKLAELPEIHLSPQALSELSKNFEAFYNDHFGFREQLIQRYNKYMQRYFGKTASRKVMIGKNGWLYLTEAQLIEDYLRLDPLTPEELERWRLNLEAKQRWLKERGIPYLFVIAPNKQSIYPEYMPDYLTQKPGQSRLDQLVDYLREKHSEVDVLDLRDSLLAAKQNRPVYYRTDTHWNHQGAYVAYRQILERMRQLYPRRRIPEAVFTETPKRKKWRTDLARMAQLDDSLLENVSRLTVKSRCARKVPIELQGVDQNHSPPFRTQCDRADLRAVMFRDSFATAVQPFLSESFKEIVYIFDQYNHAVMRQLLESGRPDVVIEEMVERYLILIRPTAGLIPVDPLTDRPSSEPRG